MTFYVTLLDGSCSIVLGHNWLTRYNPLIDWVSSSITFRTSEHPSLVPPSSAEPIPDSVPVVGNPNLDTPSTSDWQATSIEIVSPAAFARACLLEGSVAFSLTPPTRPGDLGATSVASDPADLSAVPKAYHEFA